MPNGLELRSWFHRYVAGRAIEVGDILGAAHLEAIRDELGDWRVVVILGQASLASLAAGRTPQLFVPLVSHGGPSNGPESIEFLNSVPVCSLLDLSEKLVVTTRPANQATHFQTRPLGVETGP